mgnify:CR=1 FL=1
MRNLEKLIRKYQKDQAFRVLVDRFYHLLDKDVFSVGDIRDALRLASIRKEKNKNKKIEEEAAWRSNSKAYDDALKKEDMEIVKKERNLRFDSNQEG